MLLKDLVQFPTDKDGFYTPTGERPPAMPRKIAKLNKPHTHAVMRDAWTAGLEPSFTREITDIFNDQAFLTDQGVKFRSPGDVVDFIFRIGIIEAPNYYLRAENSAHSERMTRPASWPDAFPWDTCLFA